MRVVSIRGFDRPLNSLSDSPTTETLRGITEKGGDRCDFGFFVVPSLVRGSLSVRRNTVHRIIFFG